MANAMKEAGTKPELEVFDSGDIAFGKDLIEKGVIEKPALFQIVTGISYGFAMYTADHDVCQVPLAGRRALGRVRR